MRPPVKPLKDASRENSDSGGASRSEEYRRMAAFIEPLAFLQLRAQHYHYTGLEERLQDCVDEIYTMLEECLLLN